MIEAQLIRVCIMATGDRVVQKGFAAEELECKPVLTSIRGNGENPLHCRQ